MKGLFTKVWVAGSETTRYSAMPTASSIRAVRGWHSSLESHANVTLRGAVAFD